MDAVNNFIDRIKTLLANFQSRSNEPETDPIAATPGDPGEATPAGDRWQDRAKTYAETAKVKAGPQLEKAKTYAETAKVKAGPQLEKAKEKAGPQVAKAKERLAAR